jgi:hypothetical protein
VGELILENRQIPIPDLSAAWEKYTTSFKNNFDIAKVYARWLPRLLTEEKKIDVLKLFFHILNGSKINTLPSLTLQSARNLNVPCRPKRSKALLLTKKPDFL